MTSLLTATSRTRHDLSTMLKRASRFGDSSVRLTAHGDLAVVTVPITVSSGLLDLGPTILGVRVSRMSTSADFDAVVPAAALIDALAEDADLDVPESRTMPAWASVTPPRSGWQPVDEVPADAVRLGALTAAERMQRELPNSPGEAVVRRVQRAVWGGTLDGYQLSLGACVALDGLGFLPAAADVVRVTTAGGWTRASTARGDVLER